MIWLIGGTQESRAIAQVLSAHPYPWVVTVTRPSAVRLYEGLPGKVLVGILTLERLAQFLQEQAIDCIVDASHPFAMVISRQAMATGLPYLRFERPETFLEPPAQVFPDFEHVLYPEYLGGHRVLLTVGVKALPLFAPWHSQAKLWARILPTPEAEKQALRAGFAPEFLIPARLSITYDQEYQLWQRLQLNTVITKASGEAGGVAIKQSVAKALGIRLMVIARPPITYPLQTDDLEVVQTFCEQYGRSGVS
ncbi:MAG: cobalt-precorrin-6A reductase [Gloeobacterales cyanobacterium]